MAWEVGHILTCVCVCVCVRVRKTAVKAKTTEAVLFHWKPAAPSLLLPAPRSLPTRSQILSFNRRDLVALCMSCVPRWVVPGPLKPMAASR